MSGDTSLVQDFFTTTFPRFPVRDSELGTSMAGLKLARVSIKLIIASVLQSADRLILAGLSKQQFKPEFESIFSIFLV